MPYNRKTVYIFGHKNPDTDSTCAAITYAYLKNMLDPDKEYIPAVLGGINMETSFCRIISEWMYRSNWTT